MGWLAAFAGGHVTQATAQPEVFIIAGPNGAGKTTFDAGFRNFENLYKAQADAWALYDNSGIEPVLLNWGEK
jgi:predicted ABC-type ATPase